MKRCLLFLFFIPTFLSARPISFPTWGFFIDLPEGYEYVEGNDVDRFSFQGPQGAMFDIAVYAGTFQNVGQLSSDINRRLGNTGDVAFFEYGDKAAALIELHFRRLTGWALCVELSGSGAAAAPFLVALAYAPEDKAGMDLFHLSALDSLVPSHTERRRPGPVTEFSYPRGGQKTVTIAGTDISAQIREHDAEAAQALIDREFALLRHYEFADDWKEAWIRFYRAIFRDSWVRVADATSRLGHQWSDGSGILSGNARVFAEKTLSWVQGFHYERDLSGSDFVNLVSAITEGRGDCDSRAMLWAMVLMQADIPAAIMVSRHYNHAMGLAYISGNGARFVAVGINWLVAETTSRVSIGLINQEQSDIEHWLAVIFE